VNMTVFPRVQFYIKLYIIYIYHIFFFLLFYIYQYINVYTKLVHGRFHILSCSLFYTNSTGFVKQAKKLINPFHITRSRDSSVGIATGYGLDDSGVGVRVPLWSRIFSCPRRPDRLWGPLSLLYNGYRGLFLRG
jgi:hypothetical protein